MRNSTYNALLPLGAVAVVSILLVWLILTGVSRWHSERERLADSNAQWVVEATDCHVTATLRGRAVTGIELDPSCVERAAGVGLLGLPAGPGRVSPMAQEGCTELPYALGARPRCTVRPRK